MWCRVLRPRWGALDGRGNNRTLVHPHGLGLWGKIGSDSVRFSDCIQWKLGRGNCIHFSDDDGSGRGTLRNLFPSIYALATRKNVVVEEPYSGEDGKSGWNIILVRNLNDWESDEFMTLLQVLANVQLHDTMDKVVWKLKKDDKFTVKSFYEHWVKRDGDGGRFPAMQIWKVKALPQIVFFACEASQECILTIDKLMRRGLTIVNRCYLCKEAVESCNHILLWCPVAYSLWHLVYGLMDINWVIAGRVKDELWVWDEIFISNCMKFREQKPKFLADSSQSRLKITAHR